METSIDKKGGGKAMAESANVCLDLACIGVLSGSAGPSGRRDGTAGGQCGAGRGPAGQPGLERQAEGTAVFHVGNGLGERQADHTGRPHPLAASARRWPTQHRATEDPRKYPHRGQLECQSSAMLLCFTWGWVVVSSLTWMCDCV